MLWAAEADWRAACARFQRLAWQRILETPSIRTVVLSARFIGYPGADSGAGFAEAIGETAGTARQHPDGARRLAMGR